MIKHIIPSLLFCTLLTAVACEKIDEADFAQASGGGVSEPNASTGETTATENGGGQDNLLQELPDGSLYMSAEQHAVALSYTDDDECERSLYISLCEWDAVPSAFSEVANDRAIELASKYVEGDISGWRIPTREEAVQLREIYGSTPPYVSDRFNELNEQIINNGGRELRAWEKKDSNPAYRYLCEDGTYTFSLKQGSNITKAGTKTTYHLRLVKDAVIVVK